MTLEEARGAIGREVIYRNAGLGRNVLFTTDGKAARQEIGVIQSVSDAYVFVRYGHDTGSKATKPEDLDLFDDEFPTVLSW